MKDRSGDDHSDFILDQFHSAGLPAVRVGRDIRVQCVNPKHKDSNPSLGIDVGGRMAFCFPCGWKGSYDKVAKILGLQPLFGEKGIVDDLTALESELASIEREGGEVQIQGTAKLPNNIRPWEGPFRGFSEETLKALDSRLWFDYRPDGKVVRRILWPFYQKGKLLGGTGRILPKDEPARRSDEAPGAYKTRLKEFYKAHPKYRNLKGNKVKRVLFPFDAYEGELPLVVLAEGPTSAIRLIDERIPTLAILGVENWSEHKRTILVGKGVKKVVLAFDGDPAGRNATQKIAEDLDDLFDVYKLDLPDGKDPDDLDEKWLKWIRKKVYQLGAEFNLRKAA